MAQQELPDGCRPISSMDEARQRLYEYLCALHSFVLNDGRTILTIVDDQSVDVGDGWVFTYRIHRSDDAIGPGRYFVEKTHGTIYNFGSMPSLAVHLAVYRAMQNPASGLPWPQVMSVLLADSDHCVLNVAPAITLCDEPVPSNTTLNGPSDSLYDVPPCWACLAALPSIGAFCFQCGNRLRSHEHTVCAACECESAND
jgi:hypothetical protein